MPGYEKESLSECIELSKEDVVLTEDIYTPRQLDEYKSFLRWLGKHKSSEHAIQPTRVALRAAHKHGWLYTGPIYRAHLKTAATYSPDKTKVMLSSKYRSWSTSLDIVKRFAATKYGNKFKDFVFLEARTTDGIDIRKAYDEIQDIGCDHEIMCRFARLPGVGDEDEVLCIVERANIIEVEHPYPMWDK